MSNRAVCQVAAEAADVDLAGAIQVEVACQLIVQSVSDHDASPILQLQLEVLDRHFRVIGVQVDRTDQVVHFFVRLQLLADAELELFEQVDHARLNQLVILEVARVAKLELLQVDLLLIVLEDANVEDQFAHVADLCPRKCELFLVQDGVDEFVFLNAAIEPFHLVPKELLTGEVIEILCDSHLLE